MLIFHQVVVALSAEEVSVSIFNLINVLSLIIVQLKNMVKTCSTVILFSLFMIIRRAVTEIMITELLNETRNIFTF